MQVLVVISLVCMGLALLLRGALIKTEHDWKRGVFQLIMVSTATAFILTPFFLPALRKPVRVNNGTGQYCVVHGIELNRDVVPIVYGLVRLNSNEIRAREDLFPNARSSVSGGCIVEDESEMRVNYCSECRKAEAEWKHEHKNSGWRN